MSKVVDYGFKTMQFNILRVKSFSAHLTSTIEKMTVNYGIIEVIAFGYVDGV